ncbi:H-NS histone family protein [Burkholderia orbicola]|uniref:H-NS histone family protein n=1 Tax=Burkholderia cepacia complex TaxID=87882 RepID=UPI0026555F20|nr:MULTISPECIES: H-NS histone family protein [Burkholderia cepacia complex]MDN7482267.1 H-NS histone family protein [Burkholderia orbicola]MDR5662261.1 H-NS histone family protein [Burkholderia cenocepacia]MDR8095231.1 H-NS histone family protein [Burkholderia cenocepacia]
MTTSENIAAEIAELEQKLKELRKAADEQLAREKADIIGQINELIAKYGISPQELAFPKTIKGNKAPSSKPQKGTPGKPKYRDPKTGATWTGKGKPPAWIRDAANRDEFLIQG